MKLDACTLQFVFFNNLRMCAYLEQADFRMPFALVAFVEHRFLTKSRPHTQPDSPVS